MPDSFGSRLRQRREEQQIDLIAIAGQTKIKRSLLEALERDDVSHWPCGIYRRAYIRAYAQAIRLDPDVIVREFFEAHPEPVDPVALAEIASLADGARANAGTPALLRNLMGSALGSLARLRRGLAVDDVVIAEGAPPPHVADRAEPEVLVSADPFHEPSPVEESSERIAASNDVAAESLLVEVSGRSQSNLADVPGRSQPDVAEVVAAEAVQVNTPAPFEPDLLAVAHLCTEFGRVEDPDDLQRLLKEAAAIIDATGLIVWVWDPRAAGLRPALVHGYPARMVAQLPTVKRDADNATAAAFRSGETSEINGSDHASGALVVPLLTPRGCAGVLAIELQDGREQTASVRAVATILGALLAQLVGASRLGGARPRSEMTVSPVGSFATPALRRAVQG